MLSKPAGDRDRLDLIPAHGRGKAMIQLVGAVAHNFSLTHAHAAGAENCAAARMAQLHIGVAQPHLVDRWVRQAVAAHAGIAKAGVGACQRLEPVCAGSREAKRAARDIGQIDRSACSPPRAAT